jgi:hypothetical protein
MIERSVRMQGGKRSNHVFHLRVSCACLHPAGKLVQQPDQVQNRARDFRHVTQRFWKLEKPARANRSVLCCSRVTVWLAG